MLNVHALEELLEPACGAIGSNISDKQADTEVLAMLLRDVPVSETAFNEMRGDRPFISMSIMTVAVGSPGFSKVPYLANAKPGTKLPTKNLYEDAGGGRVACYPFQKGKTNKDKGERVENFTSEITNQSESARTILEPGMCLTNFIRDECFGTNGKFYCDMPDMQTLKAGSMIYVQIAAQNINQAQQGYFFKFKRVKLASYVDSIVHKMSLTTIPKSIVDFDETLKAVKDSNTMSKQVYGGNSKFFTVTPEASSFCVHEPDQSRFVIVNATPDIPDIEVSDSKVMRACGSSDAVVSHRLFSIALAMNAVNTIVSYNRIGSLVVQSDCTACAMWTYIDFREMLMLPKICELGLTCQGSSAGTLILDNNDDYILWCDTSIKFQKNDSEESNILFRLWRREMDATGDEASNYTNTSSLITINASGPYYPLDIYLVKPGSVSDAIANLSQSVSVDDLNDVMLFVETQLNKRNLKETEGTGSCLASKKRKRPVFP